MRTGGVLPVEECRIVRTPKNEAHAWGNLSIEGKCLLAILYRNLRHILNIANCNSNGLINITFCSTEPFDLTNTARSCYDEKIFQRIKTVFNTSWNILRDTMDINKLFDQPLLPALPHSVFDNYANVLMPQIHQQSDFQQQQPQQLQQQQQPLQLQQQQQQQQLKQPHHNT